MELRAAVDVDLVAAGPGAAAWTDPEIVAGTGVRIRWTHLAELKAKIQVLWTLAGKPTIGSWSAGDVSGGQEATRRICARDMSDLRTWLKEYEDHSWALTRRARVIQQYDAYTAGSQFGRGKCERCGITPATPPSPTTVPAASPRNSACWTATPTPRARRTMQPTGWRD